LADVKWIKICTDIFDDEKIVLIEGMPEADSIIAIWFKLLCLAGKQNNGGVFMLNEKMPYTEEMFSLIFRRSLNTVRLALSTFEQFGMVEIVNKTYTIPNWEKHQNADKLDEIREYNKLKQRESRQRRKLLQDVNDNVNDMSMTCQTCQDIEEERDLDKELLTISLAREKNADVDNSVDGVDDDDPKDKQLEYMRGRLGEGLVFMSQEQFNYLLENYSLDEIYHYFEVIKEQIRMGRRYRKTHFQAIIDMAEKDRKKK
jgi:predicted phage replisome organizer